MAVIVCPWCQSEVTQEEGQEPEKFCPICENELDGYRTLRVDIGGYDEEEDEEDEDGEDASFSVGEEGLGWERDEDLREKNESLLAYEETVESLLDEQDVVPECPLCREYMLEAGERTVGADEFVPRVPEELGRPVLEAPFVMTAYVCPSCFAMQYALSENDRSRIAQRLSGERGNRREGRA